MREVPIDEAKEQLSELVDAVLAGETILISTDDHRAVRLAPVRFGKGKTTFGSGKGVFSLTDDFDAPIEGLEEYMP
jgi:antitoxin (DNA-binding transcriptional repressor) of toxin-antitoxin stability system